MPILFFFAPSPSRNFGEPSSSNRSDESVVEVSQDSPPPPQAASPEPLRLSFSTCSKPHTAVPKMLPFSLIHIYIYIYIYDNTKLQYKSNTGLLCVS